MVPFDVPGHKEAGETRNCTAAWTKVRGTGRKFHKTTGYSQPSGFVIREAEELTADAFGAENAFLGWGTIGSAGNDIVNL